MRRSDDPGHVLSGRVRKISASSEMKRGKGRILVFYGYKLSVADIRTCLLKLTDLTGALYSFSIRVVRHEIPRRKMIIDVELAKGFDAARYNAGTYIYELLGKLRRTSKQFREFVREIPAASFPELNFHNFRELTFDADVYRIRYKSFF